MKIKRFNENVETLNKYVLVTKSESGDDYIYFIEHNTLPTSEELDKFLLENANDEETIVTGEIYESVIMIEEITSDKFLRIPSINDKFI